MSETKIEYGISPDGTPGRTWPFVRGCTKGESRGCDNCFAEDWGRRSGLGFRPTFYPEHLADPLRARDSRPLTFLGAFLGDWMHPAIKDEQLLRVAEVLLRNEQRKHPHTLVIATKRAARLRDFFSRLRVTALDRVWLSDEPGGPENDLLGPRLRHFWPLVTICEESETRKAEALLGAPLAHRALSLEPLLGPVNLSPYLAGHGIDLVIVGGESGNRARPMHPGWVRTVRDQCAETGTVFYFKQWGEWAPDCLCGSVRTCAETPRPEPGRPGVMFRCGKQGAGHFLDGKVHRSLPWVQREPGERSK